MPIATFTLKSASTQTTAPFSLGHAFKQGDVPTGAQLVAGFSDVQVTVKNAWPDGSAKFAVVSGRASLSAGVALPVVLSIGTPVAGTALAIADLKATGITASIGAGAFGTVSWATTDWDTPFQSWVSGPRMSSWVYRKAVGTDAHLVAWMEVRLFAGGEVEVLPWIENGYTTVAAPVNKSATYTFTLGGTQRVSILVDLKHHQRTVLIGGSVLSYWLGVDPGVTPRHDVAYLQATELVPSYNATVASSALGLVSSFLPLQAGNLIYDTDSMPSSGYQAPIGLLPTHDVAYLVCSDNHELLYGSVLRNGYSAGRYGLCYREPATNRPLRFSSYPTLVISDAQGFFNNGSSTTNSRTPVASGGNPITWDPAHSPSVGFMAYLLTGHWYHMETVQFAAVTNYLGNGDNTILRAGSQGLLHPAQGAWQTRACAWGWRTLAQALCITPDSDTALRNEFIASSESNINDFHAVYVAQPNNRFGLIRPGESYDGTEYLQAIWQQDFVTAAFGYSVSLGLPVSGAVRTKLDAFFQWKAQSAVFRLGATASNFWYVNGDPYVVAISPSNTPDYVGGAGPWFSTDLQVYNATYNTANAIYTTPPTWLSATEGTLGGEYAPDSWGKSLWGNIQPAIAYAVRHGVTGAQAAYNRMIAASNFSALQTTFNTAPVWSVKPLLSGATVPTTGPHIVCDTLPLASAGFYVGTHRGLGITETEMPVGSLLKNKTAGGITTDEWRITVSPPTAGTFDIGELSDWEYTGPDGTQSLTETIYKNGVLLDTGLLVLNTGPADATLPVMGGVIASSNITSTGFTLSWSAATDNVAVTGYEVSIDGGITYTNVGNVLTVTETSLAPSTAYAIRVRAFDAAGNRATPLSSSVSTSAAADSMAPTMQGSLTISAIAESSFTITWIAASDNVAVTGYEVSSDNGATYVNVNSVLSYAKTSLQASTLYNVKVRAYDAAGNRSTPLSTTATTAASSDVTAPVLGGVISIFAVTTGGFTASWSAATDNVAVTGYEISVDAGTPAYVTVGTVLTSTKTGLNSATLYNVRVRAFDSAGNRSAAITTTVTTTAPSIYATSVTITFQDRNNAPRANLTGMKWAFFDQVTPDVLAQPSAKGTGATTNSAGVATLNINGTTLPPGAKGWLIFSNSDGTATQSNLISFAGPCVVA